MNKKEKIIDIEELIRSKSPKLYRFLPGFILRYLKKILHEDDVNSFITEHKNDSPIEFCLSVMKKFNIQLEYEGLENIPAKGGAVIAMNHPWGGMDAMALVAVIHEKRPDVKFIVNDILLHLDNLRPIFVGVNKLGKNGSRNLKTVSETFAGEEIGRA